MLQKNFLVVMPYLVRWLCLCLLFSGQQAQALSHMLTTPLTASFNVQPVRCAGEANGRITAIVSGGQPPYVYEWSNGETGPEVDSLAPGWYSVRIRDQRGDTLPDQTLLEITEPTPLSVRLEVSPASCANRADGGGVLEVSGGNGGYQYYWDTGERDSITISLASGSHLVQVQDTRLCLWDTVFDVAAPEPLTVSLLEMTPSVCSQPNGTITVQAVGGMGPYRYEWNTSPAQIGPQAIGLLGEPGAGFPISVEVSDENGCQQTATFSFQDRPKARARIVPYFDLDRPVPLSQASLYFANESENAVAYRWRVNDSTVSVSPDLTYRAHHPGRYHIELLALDPYFACPDTMSMWVDVVSEGRLWIPTAFTPNDDGRNDFFQIKGTGIQAFDLVIFNRWGNEVRRLRNIETGWDGRSQQGKPLPEGVYGYRLRAWITDGEVITRGGQVMLIR